MSDRTNQTGDNDDWVALLLAATDHPAMPDDVADRLDRALRDEVALRDGPGTTSAGTTSTGTTSTGTPSGAAVTPEPAADGPVPAGTSVVAGPWSGPTSAGTTRTGSTSTGTTSTGTTSTGTGTSGTTAPGGDVDPDDAPLTADPDGDGPLPSVLAGASSTWGSSRRERREEHQGERRRNMLTRWAPVAAGVLLLGGAGATAVAVLGGGGDSATESELEAASLADEAAPAPRALVATGTEYSTTDEAAFAEQVRSLVAVAGSGTDASAQGGADTSGGAAAADASVEASAPAAADQAASPPVEDSAEAAGGASADASALAAPEEARAAAVDSPLVDRAAFDACVEDVTDGSATTVAAMDVAVVDGLESTVLVVPDAANQSYLVYVVGPDCTGMDEGAFKFFTITP